MNEAKLREAEESIAGTFDGDYYADLHIALYELHTTHSDDLSGSKLLETLYRLANTTHAAMSVELARIEAAQRARAELDMPRNGAEARAMRDAA
jgi:hypothetical protein